MFKLIAKKIFCVTMFLCSSFSFFSTAAFHGNDESVSIYFDGAEPVYYPDFEPLPNFIKYQVPTDYRRLYGAIGKTKKCTLTHIGNGIAIGAGHCHLAKNDTVQWGYLGGLVEEQHFQKKDIYFTSRISKVLVSQLTETVDFAIVEVDQAPQYSIKVSDKNLDLVQKQVMIFGHPNGYSLHWSNYCQIQTVGEFNFTHNCDTQHGVSGAAIIDVSTLEIIGVHNNSEGLSTRIDIDEIQSVINTLD